MRMRLALCLLACAMASHADSVFLNADGSGDFPDIQAAFDAAPEYSDIYLSEGIYFGPGNRNLDTNGKSFLVYSLTDDPTTTILDLEMDGRPPVEPRRAFHFHSSRSRGPLIRGLTIRGGNTLGESGGAILNEGVPTTIENCIFEDNQAMSGGAIHITDSYVSMTDCHFINNLADHGGAVYAQGTSISPSFIRCLFKNNYANGNGGAVAFDADNNGWTSFTESVFWQNSASVKGGAIHLAGLSYFSITNCTFSENFAPIASSISAAEFVLFHLNYSILVWGNSQPIHGDGNVSALTCTDIYGHPGGTDWIGIVASFAGQDGNFSDDPQFCGLSDGYFALQEDSPCAPDAPANVHCPGELIGALPVECGEQSVEVMDWGKVKMRY